MKLYFEDLTLAYKTLSNKVSRAEYDEYYTENQTMLNNWEKYWGSNLKEGEDNENPEVAAERERRKRERGKKRYDEDSSFVN